MVDGYLEETTYEDVDQNRPNGCFNQCQSSVDDDVVAEGRVGAHPSHA
jgi:hypothetical protein